MKTESAAGSSDVVDITLYKSRNTRVATMRIMFKDWRCRIPYCTPDYIPLKLTPVLAAVNKIWEVTTVPDELKIKCNGVEVLHFIYNNTYQGCCEVKGMEISDVRIEIDNNATIKFSSTIGKYNLHRGTKPCLFIIYSRVATRHC